jgi:hypothetical protein
MSTLENSGKSGKTLFTFSAPSGLANNFLKYCTRALNHPVCVCIISVTYFEDDKEFCSLNVQEDRRKTF